MPWKVKEYTSRDKTAGPLTAKMVKFLRQQAECGKSTLLKRTPEEAERLASSWTSGSCIARCLLKGDELAGIMALTPSQWDTDHFGVKTAKLEAHVDSNAPENWQKRLSEQVVEEARRAKFKLIITRIPLTQTVTINSLLALGAGLFDVLATFRLARGDFPTPSKKQTPRISISKASNRDLAFLRELSRVSFRGGHLHADRRLDSKLADKAYSVIVSNQVKDSNWVVLKASKGGEPAGFISFVFAKQGGNQERCQISLLAVDASMSRQGIGSHLVSSAIDRSRKRAVADVIVSTQATNFPAIVLYERLGFRLVQSYASLHLWLG